MDTRAKLIKAKSLIDEAIEELEHKESLPERRSMTLNELSKFINNKVNAMVLAKRCKVGHSVFLELLKGGRRPMRESTKDRILQGLNIVIVDSHEDEVTK